MNTTKTNWQQAFKVSLIIFLVLRVVFSFWAVVAVNIYPIPEEIDDTLRPYLGAPPLRDGVSLYLLEPWQRHDTNRYIRIADVGYTNEEDSVFPPLYPLLMRAGGWLLRLGQTGTTYQRTMSHLIASILISNLATMGVLMLFYQLAADYVGADSATRTVVYFALFPTSFFLFAAYTESLFLLWVLLMFYVARQERFWLAGIFAFLATLTRTTGVGLAVPLAYMIYAVVAEQYPLISSNFLRVYLPRCLPTGLPVLGFLLFLGIRTWLGLPAINIIYEQYWYQTTSFPGYDLWTALHIMITGTGIRAGEITLYLDLIIALVLIVTTALAFRRYGMGMGLYCLMMLLFILLPRSDFKPLYSFSRYALVFFPLFLLLGNAGKNGIIHRLILYPFFLLFLFFSGQFFMWGWVA